MKIVTQNKKITLGELQKMSEKMFGNLVKAVVDIEKKIMVVDADLHSDQEAWLLEHESKQADLWGINIYPENKKEDWIEFDSMINLRPIQGNRSRSVENLETQKIIVEIINDLIIV